MRDFILWYLSVGAAIYIVCLIANFRSFHKATIPEILKGFVAALIWPVTIYIMVREP